MAVKDKGRKQIEKKNQVLRQLQIEYASTASIRCNTYNPNRQSDHDFELLIMSMAEDGFTQPIVCQHDHTIIDGEHRWTAAIVLHYLQSNQKELTPENIQWARDHRLEIIDPAHQIPVVFTDMSPEQMRIATLRHNRARGSEDVELTAQVLRDLEELGALDWAQDSLMMGDEEIQQLLENIPAPEALAADEYSQAWVPTKIHENETNHASTEAHLIDHGEGGIIEISAMSQRAVEDARLREKRLQEARNEQEREMVRKDMQNIYRLALIFSGDEADIVKKVLGNHAAQTLLELCKRELDKAPV